MPFDDGLPGPPAAFSFFLGVVVAGIIAVISMAVLKGVGQGQRTHEAPLRSVDAMVVGRRQDVRREADGTAHPAYFITFEEPSGEHLVLLVSGSEFGQLADGDRGHLIHQGARYKGFTRQRAVDGTR